MKELARHTPTESRLRKPRSYWQDPENVRLELEVLIREHDLTRFPPKKMLEEVGALRDAVRATGGPVYWCQQFHLPEPRIIPKREPRPIGYWTEPENVEKEILQAAEILGHFPSAKEAKKLGNTSLTSAIHKTGGVYYWRQKLGFEPLRRPNGYWHNEENIKKEIERVMRTYNLTDFPTQGDLGHIVEGSLAQAISKTGGFAIWAQRFGFRPKERPKRFWHDPETILQETRKFLKEHSLVDLPTGKVLRAMGASALDVAIHRRYPGGLRALKKALGLPSLNKRPHGTWTKEGIEAEIIKIIHEHNLDRPPSHDWLHENGLTGLASAIPENYPDGMRGLYRKLGYKYPRPWLVKKEAAQTLGYELLEAYNAVLESGQQISFEEFVRSL